MKILVAGGAGYIGSHTAVALLNTGHSLVVADNLSNSTADTLERVKQITGMGLIFHKLDVTDRPSVDALFAKYSFDAVMHFAGFKSLKESVEKPLLYFFNNTVSTMVLAEASIKYGVKRFVFSSSATVYGDNHVPFVEDMETRPATNPYGETKAISESILANTVKANPSWSVTLLRYFNPVGAHESGLIGEAPVGVPNNIMPYITKVAKGKLHYLSIYGDDYPTVDGTGVRDYIHVCDLADGHVAALNKPGQGLSVFNLGTGQGTSVFQLLKAFERVNKMSVPYKIAARRPGDIGECYANVDKAKQELGWVATRSLDEMCRDAWSFEKRQK